MANFLSHPFDVRVKQRFVIVPEEEAKPARNKLRLRNEPDFSQFGGNWQKGTWTLVATLPDWIEIFPKSTKECRCTYSGPVANENKKEHYVDWQRGSKSLRKAGFDITPKPAEKAHEQLLEFTKWSEFEPYEHLLSPPKPLVLAQGCVLEREEVICQS